MKYVFFVGNKRSGTTLLNKGLNFHPNVYSAHEADLTSWLLRSQCLNDWGEGLTNTERLLGEPLQTPSIEYFTDRLLALKNFDPQNTYKTKILACGDKKPVQHLQENHIRFFKSVRPLYLHIVRHPLAFLRSSISPEFSERYPLKVWVDEPTPDKILKFWKLNIERVQEMERVGHNVLNIRFEDFILDPELHLAHLYDILDLPNARASHIPASFSIDHDRANKTSDYNPPDEIKLFASQFGYEF